MGQACQICGEELRTFCFLNGPWALGQALSLYVVPGGVQHCICGLPSDLSRVS